ncbi:hypothetical protein [Rubrobacter radiotolerans]|uniref:Uncharacterized protein n=1 Tax=Rubrobacter radiotolerans TaxID=42256 RepID=A0AB35T7H5_RUBRA|nr:hypothetical protein [Rubrobacter radiotolerans]MDX5894557.1 hypothetical protein [Rubrobacter radiotolerans]
MADARRRGEPFFADLRRVPKVYVFGLGRGRELLVLHPRRRRKVCVGNALRRPHPVVIHSLAPFLSSDPAGAR